MSCSRLPAVWIVLAGISCAPQLVAQFVASRADRPVSSSSLYPGAGLDGVALGLQTRNLVQWTGDGWVDWVDLPPAVIGIGSIAYDPVRRTSVACFVETSGLTTYEWNASGWSTQNVPAPYGTMCFCPRLGQMLMFTGAAGSTQDYRWQGAWIPLPPNLRPFSINQTPVTDPSRGRIVALADPAVGSTNATTWEWDGVAWTQRTSVNAPPARTGAGLAFDAGHNAVVLYGGTWGGTPRNDTWRWDGTNWSLLGTIPNPLPAFGQWRLASDPYHDDVVLLTFGGQSVDQRLTAAGWQALRVLSARGSFFSIANDPGRNVLVQYVDGSTYTWDGIDWTVALTPGPSRRMAPMAHDLASNTMVLFGGGYLSLLTQLTYGDTWTFDGAAWTQQAPVGGPSPRRNHTLVAHPATASVVLFGGESPTGVALQDTWVWSNNTWVQLSPAVSPPGGMALGASGSFPNDPWVLSGNQVWQWNGTWNFVAYTPTNGSWGIAASPAGAPILYSRADSTVPLQELVQGTWVPREALLAYPTHVAFDPLRGDLQLIDRGDRYVYSSTIASVAISGTGCGSPPPSLLASEMPVIASPRLRLCAGGVDTLAAFFGDFTGANVPIGGGCTSYLAAPVPLGLGLASASRMTSVPLPIPGSTSLLGLTVLTQAVSLQPSQAPLGLAFSAQLSLTIGH